MTRNEYIQMQCELSQAGKPPIPDWMEKRIQAACALWNDPQNIEKQQAYIDAWQNSESTQTDGENREGDISEPA